MDGRRSGTKRFLSGRTSVHRENHHTGMVRKQLLTVDVHSRIEVVIREL